MTEVKILINSIDKVKNFVNILSKFKDIEFDVVSGRYVVNAKSAMGLFSLDITVPMDLQIMTEFASAERCLRQMHKACLINAKLLSQW